MKKFLFRMTLFCGVALLIEGGAYVAQPLLTKVAVGVDFTPTWKIYESQRIAVRAKRRDDTNAVFEPELGWRYRPNFRSASYNNNSQGLRGTREYTVKPANGVLRVVAFGDSFIYGNEVRDDETWSAQLEAIVPEIELFNSGVGGYGTDQAYLMYRRYGKRYQARVVLIGFTMVEVPRNVNVYRRFYTPGEIMFVKPRFVLSSNGDIELIPSPIATENEYWKYYEEPARIREFGERDFWYQPLVYENIAYDYSAAVRVASQTLSLLRRKLWTRDALVVGGRLNPQSEAFEITVKILRKFADEVTSDGAIPIIVIFPDAYRLGADEREREDVYEALIDWLRAERLEYLDLATAFDRPVTRARHFMEGGHYSPYANLLVAKAVANRLRERGLLRDSQDARLTRSSSRIAGITN